MSDWRQTVEQLCQPLAGYEGETLSVVNPATHERVTDVPDMSATVATSALDAVCDEFSSWRSWSGDDRAAVLATAASALRSHAVDLATILTLENGKPLRQAKDEVLQSASCFQWHAEETRRLEGRVLGTGEGRRKFVFHAPVGPVVAITPWNFPSSLVARKLAPALGAGCTVLIKPASQTPLSTIAMVKMLRLAGLPEDAVRVVTTSHAREVGEAMVGDARIRKVTFTGSTAVGSALMRKAADSMQRVGLELGGHAPVLVFEDADVPAAARSIVLAKFKNGGQTCISANRVYAHRSVAQELVTELVTLASNLRVGDGMKPGIDVGPLIDENALTGLSAQIDDATGRGAEVRCGGSGVKPAGLPGAFMSPTILTEVPADSDMMREESFGPVLPVVEFDDDDAALAAANSSVYGLASYVFTRDAARIFKAIDRLEYGMIAVNSHQVTDVSLPFGGVKLSGQGREDGREGIRSYLESKSVSITL